MESQHLAQALAEAGLPVDPSAVADPTAVHQAVYDLSTWYGGLDATNRTVVDTLTEMGITSLLADPDVNVCGQAPEFLAALDQLGHPLGVALQLAGQAIQTAMAMSDDANTATA